MGQHITVIVCSATGFLVQYLACWYRAVRVVEDRTLPIVGIIERSWFNKLLLYVNINCACCVPTTHCFTVDHATGKCSLRVSSVNTLLQTAETVDYHTSGARPVIARTSNQPVQGKTKTTLNLQRRNPRRFVISDQSIYTADFGV